jgi:peptide-methionine (R)-S-oxide reductase
MRVHRLLQEFSVLSRLKQENRLLDPTRFPRAPTDAIPHAPAPASALSPFQQYLASSKAMERPFTGRLWHELSTGFYHCAACDARLFTFNHKFQSHTGYPTFWRAIESTVSTVEEEVLFDEVNFPRARHTPQPAPYKRCQCARCSTHLGAVFLDGPPPTFLRYTINSALLTFREFPNFPNPHRLRRQKHTARQNGRVTYLR